ncbi:cysteine dioxygenase [Peribacillus kribbensis]|uniref:cysteine dioxygenase n=1 Tax=Peribacillus kribbensis TaxID=356658 RepID=UPI0004101F06|nr:cysteine dioxygenase family protein [Peribacillus kribbensis]
MCIKAKLASAFDSAAERLGNRELEESIKSLEVTCEDIESYIKEPEHLPYGRNCIYKNEFIEAVIIHIPADRETFVHDHGDSIGCGMVVEGELTNVLYGDSEGLLQQVSQDIIKSGDFFHSWPGDIHSMKNELPGRTLTLNLYSPPLTHYKTFK